ncbi:serine/threonine-protein kinase [Chitinasiproducens palmae]|uniref:Cyclic di-GMP-binding protein n=1 Tax=Chitinasiproducens palmae TaxID=1770053 RepID=A0A1H2PKK8_9BURK|nr:hypothetical protein [Chitinasiproducens palmae]SDV46541.1 hypothetical protein SAMN05216551_101416 [Chitinasiproducens palmae]
MHFNSVFPDGARGARRSAPSVQRATLHRVANASLLFLAACTAPALAQSNAAAGFQRLDADTTVAREVPLSALGVRRPMVLSRVDSGRELYLPVPAGVPLSNAALHVNAGYMRGDGGRTSMVLSLDGDPTLARGFSGEQGDASADLTVDGTPRDSGYLRLGLRWSSIVSEKRCDDETSIANLLRVYPDSVFRYRYDGARITDLATAWSALPTEPTLLVAGGTLTANAYESAWRTGMLLQRSGFHPKYVALPAPGETVEIGADAVPADLRGLPAFASLAGGGRHRLASPAEVGALLAVAGKTTWHADVLLADEALRNQLSQAFAALRAQVQGAAPDALPAFDAWLARAWPGAAQRGPVTADAALTRWAGQPAIAFADRPSRIAALFDAPWRRTLLAERLQAASPATAATKPTRDILPFETPDAGAGTVDVARNGEWTGSFDLARLPIGDRAPVEAVLDIAAAPGSDGQGAVASVFWNDYLLGAIMLDEPGKRQQLTVSIPAYALASRNFLRVRFQRQIPGEHCGEAVAYPVAILPSSHLVLGSVAPLDTFPGVAVRLASGADVYVRDADRAHAAQTLPRAVSLSLAAGVTPTRAALHLVPNDTVVKPAGAFVSVDVKLDEPKADAQLNDDGRVTVTRDGDTLFDARGLGGIAVAAVTRAAGQAGVAWRTLTSYKSDEALPATLPLATVALVGPRDVLASVDTLAPSRPLAGTGFRGAFRAHPVLWSLGILAAVLILIGLLAALVVRRRKPRQGE